MEHEKLIATLSAMIESGQVDEAVELAKPYKTSYYFHDLFEYYLTYGSDNYSYKKQVKMEKLYQLFATRLIEGTTNLVDRLDVLINTDIVFSFFILPEHSKDKSFSNTQETIQILKKLMDEYLSYEVNHPDITFLATAEMFEIERKQRHVKEQMDALFETLKDTQTYKTK